MNEDKKDSFTGADGEEWKINGPFCGYCGEKIKGERCPCRYTQSKSRAESKKDQI